MLFFYCWRMYARTISCYSSASAWSRQQQQKKWCWLFNIFETKWADTCHWLVAILFKNKRSKGIAGKKERKRERERCYTQSHMSEQCIMYKASVSSALSVLLRKRRKEKRRHWNRNVGPATVKTVKSSDCLVLRRRLLAVDDTHSTAAIAQCQEKIVSMRNSERTTGNGQPVPPPSPFSLYSSTTAYTTSATSTSGRQNDENVQSPFF